MIYPQYNAQHLHGFARICVNPSFFVSKKYNILFVGKHRWMNRIHFLISPINLNR